MERNVLGESNVLVVASCDRTLSCLEASWVHTSLLHPLGYRGGPFWWPGRSRFSSSQQAARVDLIGQARPPYVRPATCTRIWPPERVGRAGTGSAQRPKSPVRARPAGLVALPLAAAAPRRLHAQTRGKPMQKAPAYKFESGIAQLAGQSHHARGLRPQQSAAAAVHAQTPRASQRTEPSRRMLETN
jgi:hypothetical protein